jgi:hypothetical protein
MERLTCDIYKPQQLIVFKRKNLDKVKIPSMSMLFEALFMGARSVVYRVGRIRRDGLMPHVKIGIGALTIEYEGEQKFIEGGLMELIEKIIDRSKSVPSSNNNNKSEIKALEHDLSTNTIAQILSVKTGSDLAFSAIVKINLVKGQPSATRQEILDEMREASIFFKESYVSNFSAYLITLVKSKRVNLVSRATYALAASERKRVGDLLASAEGAAA